MRHRHTRQWLKTRARILPMGLYLGCEHAQQRANKTYIYYCLGRVVFFMYNRTNDQGYAARKRKLSMKQSPNTINQGI